MGKVLQCRTYGSHQGKLCCWMGPSRGTRLDLTLHSTRIAAATSATPPARDPIMLSLKSPAVLLSMVILVPLFALAVKQPYEYDFFMWNGAQEEYEKAHGHIPFEPAHVGADDFDKRIPEFKNKLLETAVVTGKLKGAIKIGVRGSRAQGNRAIWFTTIVHPEDSVGKEMDLQHKLALILWRQEAYRKSLLWIDMVPIRGVHWGLQDLNTVLRHF